jgi:hypothetical protein
VGFPYPEAASKAAIGRLFYIAEKVAYRVANRGKWLLGG